jgi:FHS family Na+ dependent glucose MFS transporter 1
LAYYAIFLGFGMVLASLGPTIPGLAAQTTATLSALSLVFVARSTGYLCGALLGGRLFDRFPGHPLMALMLAGIGASMAAVPLCSTLATLTAIFILLGVSEGALDAGGNTLLSWTHADNLGPWMNGLHLAFGVGALLSPLIVVAVMGEDGSVANAYWVLAAATLPVTLFVAVLPSPPIARHADRAAVDLRPHRRTIILVITLLFAAVGAEVGFGNWIYTYSLQQEVADEDTAALLTSVFWGTFTLGRLIGIPLATRLRPETIVVLGFVGGVAGSALPLVEPASQRVLWLAAILGGLALAPLFATILAVARQRMPISGRATGWFFVGSSAGGMAIPWLIGQLIEAWGPTWVFVVVFVDAVLGLGVCFGLRWRRPAAAP